MALYALTGGLATRYNQGLNDEHERQVDAVDSGDPARLGKHLRAMMRWNIRLSDLEAANFGINWAGCGRGGGLALLGQRVQAV